MSLPIAPILGILADNVKQRGSVLPLSKKAATGWANGLNLPKGGETVIYTGHMYQLIPAIDAMSRQMAMFEESPITKFFGIGRLVNKFINMSFFMSLTASKEMKKENNRILRNIVSLLRKAGEDFGYLYGDEMYSGALIYDEGLDEIFIPHAKRVFEKLKKNGVKKIITVDPHTTNMMRDIYPKVVPGYDIEVKSYIEVLAEKAPEVLKKCNKELVIHDSCVYARYENMVDQPRILLKNAGVDIKQPELSRKSTHCCGGPIEALFPAKAHEVAGNRIEQLSEQGKDIVTMCPICLVNLRKAAEGKDCQLKDISDTLADAYL